MFSSLDISFIEWLNQHSSMSPFINKVIHIIADRDEFKGLIFMTVFWSLWFFSSDKKANHKILLGTLLACFVSLLISRSITELITNRPRPMISPTLGFETPIGLAIFRYSSLNEFFSQRSCSPIFWTIDRICLHFQTYWRAFISIYCFVYCTSKTLSWLSLPD